MAAPTNYFVDPSLGSDTGDGSVGTPWGRASGSVTQYALNTGITRDATNGDQINIKSDQAVGVTTTTDDTLGAALDLTTYGTPTEAAPLILRGYTSTANDGGIGGLNGAGSYAVISTSGKVFFCDLHLHNSGAADIVTLSSHGGVIQCEVNTTTGAAVVVLSGGNILNNHIHTFGTYGINSGSTKILGNYISDANATAAIAVTSNVYAAKNIITIAGATDGIQVSHDGTTIEHNSILSAGGSGQGIIRAGNRQSQNYLNNLIEGFSGGGGIGIDLGAISENVVAYGHNAVHNCAAAYSIGSADFIIDLGDNESLGDSPFAKSGADTFANRFTYFAPLAVDNVQGGAYPSGSRLDKGAVQHAAAGGGGLLVHPGTAGGARG